MLYVYYGEDVHTSRAKVQATTARMLAKNPEALYFRVTEQEVSPEVLEELTQSQALFKSEYVVVLDMTLQHTHSAEIVLAHLEQLQKAPHPVFLLDGALKAPEKKKLARFAEKIEEFTLKAPPRGATFNTFALTDALMARNTKQLWALFREAKARGVRDEEIHGILFWAYKTLLLVAHADTPESAGLKPYPFEKAKRALSGFGTTEDVAHRVERFVLLPQHARKTHGSLEVAIEHHILSYT